MRQLLIAASALMLTMSPGTGADAPFDVEILKRGATLHGTASVNVSPQGRLFVAETDRSRIIELHPLTGEILLELGPADGVFGAADLDFDAAGTTLFWNNYLSGEVYKRNLSTGVSTELAALHGIVDSVALNHQGRLFAAQLAPLPALWEIDPRGVNPPRLVASVFGMHGIDAGPDGHVYTPDFFGGSGEVRRVNVDTGEVTAVAAGLQAPIAVKFDSLGRLHVAEQAKGLISRIDVATGSKTPVAKERPGTDKFDFDPGDRIYTANIMENSIQQLNGFGPVRFLSRPGLGTPGPIVVRQGKLGLDVVTVSDAFSLRTLLGLTGTMLDQTPVSPLPTELSLVQSLSDDGTHYIVTNFITNLVQVWDPVSKRVVSASQTFQVPMNAIRFQGELAVAELGSGQVVRGSDRQPYIAGLTVPAGLAATDDDLYVADHATGTIYQAVKDGVIQTPPAIVAAQLLAPEGLAIDNDGNLLVVETGRRRLVRVDLATHHLDVIADDLAVGLPAIAGWPPTGKVLTGVAVSRLGTIYVAGDIDNVVYRIRTKRSSAFYRPGSTTGRTTCDACVPERKMR